MEPRTIKNEKPNMDYLQRLIDEYDKSKAFADKAAARVEELKKVLKSYVADFGTADDKGHKWLAGETHQLKNERRVSRAFDTKAGEKWAKTTGHWESVKRTVEVLDEDALMALVWDNPELEEEVSKLYTEKETWAFKVVEGKSYEDE